MSWKLPIPIDIYDDFGEDFLARDLFIHLLLKARSEDMQTEDYYIGKPFKLKRGQCIFGKKEYAKQLRTSESGVVRATLRLMTRQGKYQVTRQPNANYTVISIKNYDQIVSMERQKSEKWHGTWHGSDTALDPSIDCKIGREIEDISSMASPEAGGWETAPRKGPNKVVEYLGTSFFSLTGQKPIDTKWRWEAANLDRKVRGKIRETGRSADDQQVMGVLGDYFRWLSRQSWGANLTRMRAVREHFETFYAEIKGTRKGVIL